MSINISKIQKIAPNANAVSEASVSRSKPDSLEEARMKVISKLNRNIEYVENQMKLPKGEKIDLVFKVAADGTYAVGAKYGNRWLNDLFGENDKFAEGITKDQLVSVMRLLIEGIESGDADESIIGVQQKNKDAHKKAA